MRATIVLSLSCATALALPVFGQEAPPFAGEEQVTAVDVVMELPGGVPEWLPGGRAPRPQGLTAAVDGVAVPLVAVARPARILDHLVVYVDAVLCDDYQLTWSLLLLADRARSLVEAGPVEVVVAAPSPTTVLSPTRDADAVEEALARLAFFAEGEDRLVALRLERSLRAPAPTDPGAGNAPATPAVAAERELVQERLDTLLLALVDRSEGPDPRRAALVISGGFDLDAARLGGPTEESGRTLAAYGWRLVPVLAPEQAGPIPGPRIGKLRLVGLGREGRILPGLPILGATFEEDRDPERAEAHLDLAEALLTEGDAARAAAEAEAAVHHFAGDPRTADRQAAALVVLGTAHQAQGDPQRAHRAFRRAARFDPDALAGHPVTAAVPADPAAALATLAEPGGGAPIRGDDALRQAVAGFGRRAVVTVQIPGSSPEGEVVPVEVMKEGSREPAASGWLRHGTPRAVIEARARRGD